MLLLRCMSVHHSAKLHISKIKFKQSRMIIFLENIPNEKCVLIETTLVVW